MLLHENTYTLTQVKPTGNKILFRPDPPPEEERGMLLPEKARKKSNAGTVVKLGFGKREKDGSVTPIPLKVGDRVLASHYAGQEVDVDGVPHKILDADKVHFRFPDGDGGTFAPLGDRVLVRMVERRIESDFLHIPDTVQQDESLEAEVIALGTGGTDRYGEPVVFKVAVGQRVFVSMFVGTDVKLMTRDHPEGAAFRVYANDEIEAVRS